MGAIKPNGLKKSQNLLRSPNPQGHNIIHKEDMCSLMVFYFLVYCAKFLTSPRWKYFVYTEFPDNSTIPSSHKVDNISFSSGFCKINSKNKNFFLIQLYYCPLYMTRPRSPGFLGPLVSTYEPLTYLVEKSHGHRNNIYIHVWDLSNIYSPMKFMLENWK